LKFFARFLFPPRHGSKDFAANPFGTLWNPEALCEPPNTHPFGIRQDKALASFFELDRVADLELPNRRDARKPPDG
jgi:hypothetical protein